MTADPPISEYFASYNSRNTQSEVRGKRALQTCPAPRMLQALAEGTLSDSKESVVSKHIDNCPACQDALGSASRSASALDNVEDVARDLADSSVDDSNAIENAATIVDPRNYGGETERSKSEQNWSQWLDPTENSQHLGRLDHYEIIEVIGKGGMGVVFRAHDPSLKRTVAIKVLSPESAYSDEARQRFVREARSAAAINHPNVVTIYAVEESAGRLYLVMECVEGRSLAQILREQGPLPVKEIVRIGYQISVGLAAAHAKQLIHRDIKPANILIEDKSKRVKITDFGLARTADDVSVTQSGVVPGTPAFLAP